MGAARKLQAEIDRTLKKVQEGIVEFDQIWEKVYETESQSQREKYEADLKKEIKKLQRLRDQIKTWIAGTDIKDKTVLMEARRNIEKEMERFKHCEKEAKTKAFSKAGLGQAVKLDPEEKARQVAREWLNEQVECLQMQIDEFEAELEGINGSRRGKKPSQRQQTLEELVVRHKSHITRLEQCMRCLDNGTITHEEIDELKDMVEYYVAENDDEDSGFDCVDETYAPLLDRLNDVTLGLQSATIASKAKKSNDLEEEQAEREREKERAAAAAVKAQLMAHGGNAATVVEEEKKASSRPVPISASSSQSSMKRRVSMSEVPSGNHVVEELEGTSPTAKTASLGTTTTTTTTTTPAVAVAVATATAVVAAAKNETTNGAISFASAAAGRNTTNTQGYRTSTVWDAVKGEDGDYPKLALSGTPEKSKSLELTPEVKPNAKRSSVDTGTLSGSSGGKGSSSSMDGVQGNLPKVPTQESLREKPLGFKAAVLSGGGGGSNGGPSSSKEEAIEVMDPQLSVLDAVDLIDELSMSCTEASGIPLLPSPFEGNPAASLQLLQACSRRSMPQPVDCDYKTQLSQNTSRSVVQQLPASFPIHRLPQLEDPSFYQKLDTEGLFYAFYFHPGNIAQFCAAKELKRQSWRYHIEQKAWFRRSGEPKTTTKDFEEGGYVYFDKDLSEGALPGEPENLMNGWCYRKKDNFVFCYDQLEDELH